MLLPGVVLLFIFHYIPLSGIIIAFQKFIPAKGLFGNQVWVGLYNFRYLITLPNTFKVLYNTVVIAFYKIAFNLAVPILVALLLNELANLRFKKSIQTVIYFPHFLSWIIFGGILIDILSPSSGLVNKALGILGIEPVYFLGDKRWFPVTVVVTDVFKNFGFGTVVYLAAISNIDPTLYEAAAIDGASRLRQTIHVTLPGMRMIIVLMMVLSLGNVLNAGFDQIFNLYNQMVMETGDIIDTLVYRMGLIDSKYGPATAVGLFKSVVSFVFISISYYIAYRFFDYRLF